jgi:hypothetical protein
MYEDEMPEDAVRIDPCGHTFGALCLAHHFEINPVEAKCPVCRVDLYGIPMQEQRAERERHSSQRYRTESLMRAIERAVAEGADGTLNSVEVENWTRRLFAQNAERVEEVLNPPEGLSDSTARKRVRDWIRKIQEKVINAARPKRGDVPIPVLSSISVTNLTTATSSS